MSRNFSKIQKKIIEIVAGNKCQICGKNLKSSFHGDHVFPFSKGVKTILKNSQAMCANCNLKKGSKI